MGLGTSIPRPGPAPPPNSPRTVSMPPGFASMHDLIHDMLGRSHTNPACGPHSCDDDGWWMDEDDRTHEVPAAAAGTPSVRAGAFSTRSRASVLKQIKPHDFCELCLSTYTATYCQVCELSLCEVCVQHTHPPQNPRLASHPLIIIEKLLPGQVAKGKRRDTVILVFFAAYTQLLTPVMRELVRQLQCTDEICDAAGVCQQYLRIDTDVVCHGSPYIIVMAFGILGFILWGAITPLLFFWVLYTRRQKLHTTDALKKWGFLYKHYHYHSYYWEPIGIIRKLILVILGNFEGADYDDRISLLQMAMMIFLLLLNIKHPYNPTSIGKLDSFFLWINIVNITIYNSWPGTDVEHSAAFKGLFYSTNALSIVFAMFLFHRSHTDWAPWLLYSLRRNAARRKEKTMKKGMVGGKRSTATTLVA